MFKYLSFSFISYFAFLAIGISQDVALVNPSFEGKATLNGLPHTYLNLQGWEDCGKIKFRGTTPPDIHPANFWENEETGNGVNLEVSHGNTYVGMVVRQNNTYESITQELTSPLSGGNCYVFSVDLARSTDYWSSVDLYGGPKKNFNNPVVLRIWGSNSPCYTSGGGSPPQLLAESAAIRNTQWQTNIFSIKPNKDYKYITLEAFYKTPLFEAYIGHLLIDNASAFKELDCGDDEALIAVLASSPKEDIVAVELTTPVKKNQENNLDPASTQNLEIKSEEQTIAKPTTLDPKPGSIVKQKIIKDLDEKKLVTGQRIKIEKLYFEADSTLIPQESYEVLEEVAEFLKDHDNIKVEIGGHTNGIPKHEYCDKISTQRAKAVANHLIELGVDVENLEYKGYGKRQPIASNNSIQGRKRNQRVEIKILKV